jgi:hypothetical protein
LRARQLHGIGDIGHAVTSCNQRRTLVDQTIVHPAGILIAGFSSLEQAPSECLREIFDGSCEGHSGSPQRI